MLSIGAAALLTAAMPAAAWPLLDGSSDENALIASLRAEARALELGLGMERDDGRAAGLYCRAARLGDSQSQLDLGWMYANGRGVARDDSVAAFFYQTAAEQGVEQARAMLRIVGGPTTEVPDCMREPSRVKAAGASALPAMAPAAAQLLASAPKVIADLVAVLAPQYQVRPELVLAIIRAESNFDVAAISPKQAMGLMQLLPQTAARFHVGNPYDPAQNLRGGIAYLRWLLAYFQGDLVLVTAAYNAGEGAVERYRGVPPYAETRAYVQKVLQSVGTLTHPFDASASEPSRQLAAIQAPRRAR